jgi:hypothetical protein
MIAASLHHTRKWRLACRSGELQAAAIRNARDGATMRARQAAALSEALHWRAGGDRQGVTLALMDAKFYARCKRKETQR